MCRLIQWVLVVSVVSALSTAPSKTGTVLQGTAIYQDPVERITGKRMGDLLRRKPGENRKEFRARLERPLRVVKVAMHRNRLMKIDPSLAERAPWTGFLTGPMDRYARRKMATLIRLAKGEKRGGFFRRHDGSWRLPFSKRPPTVTWGELLKQAEDLENAFILERGG